MPRIRTFAPGAIRYTRAAMLLAALHAASSITGTALAQDQPRQVSIEINRLDENASDCRITVVERNATDVDVGALKLDLVVFDAQGIVAKRVAVDAGALKSGRTFVRTFDLKQIACPQVARILLNNVLACEMGNRSPDDCVDAIAVSSRASVPFEK